LNFFWYSRFTSMNACTASLFSLRNFVSKSQPAVSACRPVASSSSLPRSPMSLYSPDTTFGMPAGSIVSAMSISFWPSRLAIRSGAP
jgi:hypothetical protein